MAFVFRHNTAFEIEKIHTQVDNEVTQQVCKNIYTARAKSR